MAANFIKRFLMKAFAKQLRQPSGLMATNVGNRMNIANGFLYKFTIDVLQLKANDAVLEIGFGNGKFFDKLFSKAPNISISGLDFSKDMVKQAKQNNLSSVAGGQLNLAFGSSDSMPFADNSFDKVFCLNVVYFWRQPTDHLIEIYRVLKPGGKFYASIRTKESMLQMPFIDYGFTMYEEDDWKKILAANNFQFVKTESITEPEAEFEGRHYKVESLCIVAQKKMA